MKIGYANNIKTVIVLLVGNVLADTILARIKNWCIADS